MMDNTSTTTQPNEVPTIPPAYAALGVTQGYDPRPPEDLRMFLIGPSGEGKTTFAASIPDNLILDFEGGANATPGARSVRVRVKDYGHLISIKDQLLKDKARRPFRRITIDTIDENTDMVGTQLALEKNTDDITEFGHKGHGWALMRNRTWAIVKELERAGYVWTVVGHLTEKIVTDMATKKETTAHRPLLFDSFAKMILRNSDMYLSSYCIPQAEEEFKTLNIKGTEQRVKVGTRTVDKYYLLATSTGGCQAKKRGVPSMQSRIEVPLAKGWDVFSQAYTEAVQTEKNKLGD